MVLTFVSHIYICDTHVCDVMLMVVDIIHFLKIFTYSMYVLHLSVDCQACFSAFDLDGDTNIWGRDILYLSRYCTVICTVDWKIKFDINGRRTANNKMNGGERHTYAFTQFALLYIQDSTKGIWTSVGRWSWGRMSEGHVPTKGRWRSIASVSDRHAGRLGKCRAEHTNRNWCDTTVLPWVRVLVSLCSSVSSLYSIYSTVQYWWYNV